MIFIIWKVEQLPRADKSALAAINRALRVAASIHDISGISLKFIIGPYGCREYFVHRHYIRSDESSSLIGQRLPGVASIAAREDLARHKEARDKRLGPETIDKE